MSKNEKKIWRGFFIAIILTGVIVGTVWAISMMVNGTGTFTTADPLTLSIIGINGNAVVYDQGDPNLNCQADFAGDRWIVKPENSSSMDICAHDFEFTTDAPVYIGDVTQDPLAAGILTVTLFDPPCGTLIPAGTFSVVLHAELGGGIPEGTVFDFTDFTLEFDEAPTTCP